MNWEEEKEAVIGQKLFMVKARVSEAQVAFSKSLPLSSKFSFGESRLVTFAND
jgi:hypothetical protein